MYYILLWSLYENVSLFHSLEVVDRVSETQLQVGENSYCNSVIYHYACSVGCLVSEFSLTLLSVDCGNIATKGSTKSGLSHTVPSQQTRGIDPMLF